MARATNLLKEYCKILFDDDCDDVAGELRLRDFRQTSFVIGLSDVGRDCAMVVSNQHL